VATAADAIDPNAANEDPNAAAPPEEQQRDDTPPEIVELAREIGWTPREEYTGPPEDFKDARTFIRDGRDIQRETSRELKNVRQQLETVARTSASIVEQQVKERVDQLGAQYAKAVEDGDAATAFKLSREIDTTLAAAQPRSEGPPPEAQAFAERNSSWFKKPGNEYATARAIEMSNLLASQGYTEPGAQLRIVEERMRQEFPQLFKAGVNGKPAPGVNSPGSRAASASNRQKGFSDMPKAAQDIAIDMEARGVIKSKDDYARNYFANEAAKG
jgi:hypothetical protein